MKFIYLICVILGISGQNISKKIFSHKASGGVYTFSMLSALAATAFFLITARDPVWNAGLLPYALFFAFSYGTASIFGVLALSCGPLSLTALITSFSLMIPTFYGLIFLKDPVSFGLYPGLALLAASLFLINKKGINTSKLSLKWFVYVLLAFLGNGLCSVAQAMQQKRFEGQFKNEFMITALLFVVLIMGVATLCKERKDFGRFIKVGWHLSLLCGALNGMVNMFVMILTGLMSVSLMFPLISVGGIVVTFIVSKVFYKEKLTTAQHIGFLLGIGAIVFLNL